MLSFPTQTVQLPQGPVCYCDVGTGPTVVLVHGLLVNRHSWAAVLPDLAASCRCIVPDLPLGAHPLALPTDTDLTPPGLAQLLVDFMAALDLQNVILVGHDTGGALTQLVLTSHPERVSAAVLINCDTFEYFFPPGLNLFQLLPRIPGGVTAAMALLQQPFIQRLIATALAYNGLTPEQAVAFFSPASSSPAIRHDLAKVLRGISNRYTLAAARAFRRVHQPVLIIWGQDDLFYVRHHAERLQRALPNATLEWVAASRTFVPLDQPARLVQLLATFVEHHSEQAVINPPTAEFIPGRSTDSAART